MRKVNYQAVEYISTAFALLYAITVYEALGPAILLAKAIVFIFCVLCFMWVKYLMTYLIVYRIKEFLKRRV